jgi:hypothetical protein
MKRIAILFILVALPAIVLADASDPSNGFAPFGNCEGVVFTHPSSRTDFQTMSDVQHTVGGGVLGNCLLTSHSTGRFEGGSDHCTVDWFSGTDVVADFYYKIPTTLYSYPRLAVRQNPNWPPTVGGAGEVGDCSHSKEWTNTSWTVDTSWHHFVETLTTLNWDSYTTADFFVNNYAVPEWYLDEIWLSDPTPKDASDDPNNAFKAIGDCEGDIFVEPSARASYQYPALLDYQTTCTGFRGKGLDFWTSNTGTRFEASTADQACYFTGPDVTFQFYYKIPQIYSSYPRFALRQGPNTPGSTGEAGDCAHYVEWTATSPGWTVDSNWHLFTPDISALSSYWASIDKVDFFTNDYHASVPLAHLYLDEIYLDDPTPRPPTQVKDWGLF